MLALAGQIKWSQVFPRARALFCKHAEAAAELLEVSKSLPQAGFLDLWRKDCDDFVQLKLGSAGRSEDQARWRAALEPYCDHLEVRAEDSNPDKDDEWVRLAFDVPPELPGQVKEAYSSAMRNLGEVGGYLPGGWTDSIGGPTPLSGMLASGMIGAGLGYGTGWVGEQLLPRAWRKGKLRRTLAMMGGLAGAVPGAWMMADNLHKGRNFNSGALTNYPNTSETLHYLPQLEDGSPNPDYDPNIPGVPLDYKQVAAAAEGEVPEIWKQAASRTGFELEAADFYPPPIIPVDAFNQRIYQDPFVASRLSPPMQAAASGLLEAAYQARGGGPRLIGPADIARISAGMGSGYLAGAIVGKALGALMGMPEPAQDRLRQTGLWAGVVANLVPLAFGAR